MPLSSALRGTCKLPLPAVLRLASKDEVILFIPPQRKGAHPAWAAAPAHDEVMTQLRRSIMSEHCRVLNAAERDAAWELHLQKRQIKRDGTYGHEFHLSVKSYAECPLLELPKLPDSEVSRLLSPHTGAGITFELLGYGSEGKCHIKFNSIKAPLLTKRSTSGTGF